jgi:menaquinone-dependent protoporphyrinogen oxidase
MTKILIAYGTTEGQTARIAQYISDVIRGRGHEAQTIDIRRSSDALLDGYDAVIVGGSIHMGKHENYVRDFVQKNRDTLERLPSAFFSVSLAAHGDMENAHAYVENFEQETGWRRRRRPMLALADLGSGPANITVFAVCFTGR